MFLPVSTVPRTRLQRKQYLTVYHFLLARQRYKYFFQIDSSHSMIFPRPEYGSSSVCTFFLQAGGAIIFSNIFCMLLISVKLGHVAEQFPAWGYRSFSDPHAGLLVESRAHVQTLAFALVSRGRSQSAGLYSFGPAGSFYFRFTLGVRVRLRFSSSRSVRDRLMRNLAQ